MSKDSFINPGLSPAKLLFVGNIAEDAIFPFPQSVDSEQEETLRMVLNSVDRFMESNAADYPQYDTSGEQPDEYLLS